MFEIKETDKEITVKFKETTEFDITNEITYPNGITVIITMEETDKNGNKLTQKDHDENEKQMKKKQKHAMSNGIYHFTLQNTTISNVQLQSIKYNKEHGWTKKEIEENKEILQRLCTQCETVKEINKITRDKNEHEM